MEIVNLREFWLVVETTQAKMILSLSDAELVQQFLLRVKFSDRPTRDEIAKMSAYIYAKIPLIRDLAQMRL